MEGRQKGGEGEGTREGMTLKALKLKMTFYEPSDHSVHNSIPTLLMHTQVKFVNNCLAVLNKHYIFKFQDTENVPIHNSQ